MFNIEELREKSDYIQSLCVNKLLKSGYWQHFLPLKAYDDGEKLVNHIDPEEWALSEEQKKTVQAYLDDLTSYASYVTDNEKNIDFEELLPGWVVFPLYTSITIGWRMGLGESYGITFGKWWQTLSDSKKKAYLEKYPRPEYIRRNENKI